MPNVPNPTAPRFVEDGFNYRRITCRGQDPSPVRKLGLWQPPKCRSGNTHCDFLRIKYWSCHMRSLSQQFPTSKLNKHGPSKTSICIHLVVATIGRNLDPKSRFHFGQSSEGGLEPVLRSKKFQGCREKDTPKLETNGMSSCRTMCSWRDGPVMICMSLRDWMSANPYVTFERGIPSGNLT